MMRELFYSSQFKKDSRRTQKQGKDLVELKNVVARLVAGEMLDEKLKDHALRGNYAGTRECHIGPDWLLIYRITGNELHVLRTGSHAELFKK